MKTMMLILSGLFLLSAPKVSSSQMEIAKDLKGTGRSELLCIRDKLRDNIRRLSLLRKDLKLIYMSMGAAQSRDRLLVIKSHENMANVEKICVYVEDLLENALLIRKDKLSYYYYLEEHGIERKKQLATKNLNNIRIMYRQISSTAALELIDKAIKIMCSSSEVLDKTVEILQRTGTHHVKEHSP